LININISSEVFKWEKSVQIWRHFKKVLH
jgi:hypothetical protein